MNIIFGVDVGGTMIKIGKFADGIMIDKVQIPTNVIDNSQIIPDIIKQINEMKKNDTIIGIGFGVPGPTVNGIVYGCNNLGWENKVYFKEEIEKYFPGVIVEVINDANAAALGEISKTFNNLYKNAVFVTLGTGIGGGIIINNEIYSGFSGSAGEIGHIKVNTGNIRKCTCGLFDCVEQYASATGIEKTAKEIMNIEITCKEVFELCKKNNSDALRVIDDASDKLGIALASVANTINPEIIIVGGGVSKAGDFFLDKIKSSFQQYAFHTVRDTKFSLAKLGNDAGMYGCYYLVKERKHD